MGVRWKKWGKNQGQKGRVHLVCPLPIWVVKSGEAKAKKLLKMMMGRHKLFLFFNSSLVVLVCGETEWIVFAK
jgi:hypothetical protein